jgi:hypothetical protein
MSYMEEPNCGACGCSDVEGSSNGGRLWSGGGCDSSCFLRMAAVSKVIVTEVRRVHLSQGFDRAAVPILARDVHGGNAEVEYAFPRTGGNEMKQLGLLKTAACATLLLAAFSPRAVRADNWDRKTIISFSDDVKVPGTTLPAGKYVFKLWDSPSDRYVVQIFNERQNHVYATLLTIPDYRTNPPDKTLVTFYESPAGQPQPIKAWFYPGDNNGREFVYSKSEADIIASAAHQVVPTNAAVAQNTLVTPQPAVASESTSTESAASETEQSTIEEDAHAAAPAPAPVAAEPEPKQESPMVDDDAEDQQPTPPPDQPATPATPDTSDMPKTGSELPLAGLIGLSSIAAAVSVRAIRRLS